MEAPSGPLHRPLTEAAGGTWQCKVVITEHSAVKVPRLTSHSAKLQVSLNLLHISVSCKNGSNDDTYLIG